MIKVDEVKLNKLVQELLENYESMTEEERKKAKGNMKFNRIDLALKNYFNIEQDLEMEFINDWKSKLGEIYK